MKKLVIFITIFVSVILSQFIFINNVKAYNMSSWIDVSNFTLPNGINTDNYNIVIFQRTENGPYRLVYIPKDDNHYFGRNVSTGVFPYTSRIATLYGGGLWYQNYYYDSSGPNDYSITTRSSSTGASFTAYKVIYTNTDIYDTNIKNDNYFFNYNEQFPPKLFNIEFVQGPVIMSNYNGRIANLLSYYVKPKNDNININDYKFCYIENTGGFRDGETCFNLDYWENGELINNVRYYYYYNLPLFYNIGLSYYIYDNENNLIQTDTINAYLNTLPDLDNYSIYNFYNYEYANMSNINSGYFAISKDLINNVDINVINYDNNSTQSFLNSTYYDSSNSYIDSNGYQWYNFNFNNEHIYLQIINNVNNITDFWAYVENYDLKLIFDNNAYVHLSGNASAEENKDNPVNQQSYMDNNGNIHYVDNPVISDFSDTSGFMSHIKDFFPNINSDTFGLTSIVTAPLSLIQSLVSKTCSPLVLPLPYTNQNITLPCMTQIYKFYYPLLYDIYEVVLFGIVSYKVIVNLFYEIMKMRQATINSAIEVFDL